MSIIAISRGTFSGGEALAERVAERLGYQCLSREMNLDAAAKEYGLPGADLTAAMDKRPAFWTRVVGQSSAYLTFVRAAMCEQVQGGKVVYHGHLGHLLLPGIAHVIAVRVIAGLAFRCTAAQQQQKLAREGALAYIKKVDKERQTWTRFLFEVDWDDPHLYDVVLNLSHMSLETACETVAHLTERPEFQPTAASRKTMQDLTLQSRVSAALLKDLRTREASLQVAADDGTVTVTGKTPPGVAEAVPLVVGQLHGVQAVRLMVTEVSPLRTPD
jgi:cytidylate kinase